jgi:hypothetical protein
LKKGAKTSAACFQEDITEINIATPSKYSGLISGEDIFSSSENKQHRTAQRMFFVGKNVAGAEITNIETVLGLSPCEDVGFRNNKHFLFIQRYM